MSKKEEIEKRSDSPQGGLGLTYTKANSIKNNRVEVIATADDSVNTGEPSSPTHSEYLWNKSETSISGHVREVDDTPGAERIMEMHRSGTFHEIHPDGTKVTRIYGDDFHIALVDHTLYVGGNLNISVQGNANLLVKGDLKTKVGGNYTLTVHGDMTTRVRGKTKLFSKGNLDIQTKANFSLFANGTSNYQSLGKMSFRTSAVFQSWSDGRTYIDGSRIDFNLKGPSISKIKLSDPTGGLNISDSISEPSSEAVKVLKNDDPELNSVVSDKITYPKDRIQID